MNEFKGTVKWFSHDKGYGFIKPDNSSQDIFLHVSVLKEAGILEIADGQRVSFNVAPNKGKDSAVDIKLI